MVIPDVQSHGRKTAKEYRVDLDLLSRMDYTGPTTLKAIEPHRLRELIIEDVRTHPHSAFGDIHKRIGPEIAAGKVRNALRQLEEAERVFRTGSYRWTRYSISQPPANES